MTSTTTSTMSSTSSSATLIPTSLRVGQQVNIESRTWPGINKPGGHATITKLHYSDNDTPSSTNNNTTNDTNKSISNNNINGRAPIKIDVKYILGGSEKHIELSYVKPYIELCRGGRSRRVDKKMNVESFTKGETAAKKKKEGGERKRKALGDIDKNGGDGDGNDGDGDDKGVVKKKKKKTIKKKASPVVVVVEGDDTKSSDVPSNNKRKQKEEGKQKKKAGSDGSGGGGGATKKKTTKSIASYFTTATTTTTTSVKTSSTSTTSTSTSTTFSASATTTKKKTNATPSKPQQRVKYSPNSILAVRAAHAKSYAAQNSTTSTLSSSNSNNHQVLFDTTTIGYELPVGRISGMGVGVGEEYGVAEKKKKKMGGNDKMKKVGNNSKQESLFPEKIMEERKKGKTSSLSTSVTATATSSTKTASSSTLTIPTTKKLLQSNHKTIQSLYKNECVKAQDFVNSMVGSTTTTTSNNNDDDDVTSSPESCLELKMDSGRMNLFNSLLSEIMFKKGIDSMDIDEMIYTMNTTSTSTTSSSSSNLLRREEEDDRPFTLLEVKTYLQKLHDENRIFVSWDDGNSGIVYSI